MRAVDRQRLLGRLQRGDDALGQGRADFLAADLLVEARALQLLGDLLRETEAEIGADQQLFQLVERRLIELALGDDAGDAFGQALRRTRQPRFQPAEKAWLIAHAITPDKASRAASTMRTGATLPIAAAPVKRTGA